MPKIAVVLSGCGFKDGSEIYETTLALRALDEHNCEVQCFAPDKLQTKEVNHLNDEESTVQRNVLHEAARLARGEIKPITEALADDFDALIFPGGFGAALNLCDFGLKGVEMSVDPDVEAFAKTMIESGKTLGFICIAPVMIPRLYPAGVKMTIGNDSGTAEKVTAMGAEHIDCDETDCVVDTNYKVISTPAYMTGTRISQVQKGIDKLIDAVVSFCM